MLRFTFRKGLRFVQGQKSWTLLRKLPTHKFQFEDEAGAIDQLSRDEVFERWHSRTWSIDETCLGENSNVFYLASPRDLSTFSQRHQETAKRRMALLSAAAAASDSDPSNASKLNREDPGIQAGQSSVLVESPQAAPHRTTLYRWRIRYASGKDIVALVDQRVRSGRRRNPVLYRYFEDALNVVYLSNQKHPKVAVYEEIKRQIDRLNKSQPIALQLKPPSRATVFNWLRELDAYLVDIARLGKAAADRLHRQAIGSAPASSILERVEIDHSPLDLLVVDKATMVPIGRPWITKATCRFSRAILGFHLSFSEPSSLSVLRCLKQVMLPKTDLLKRYPDIKNDWPMHGIPEQVVSDNGLDLHSLATEELCFQAGIHLIYCLPADPANKGSIERSFRTMNQDLIHKLPGTVFSNPKQRGDYPSEKEAVLDLDDVTHLITKWIVDVYHQTAQRELKARPIDVWNSQLATKLIEYPAHPDAFDIAIGEPSERSLFLYGIEFEGLHYNNDELQAIRRRSGKSLKIKFKYFEDDITFIQVWDEDQKEYLRVGVRPKHADYVLNLNRHMHRVIRAHQERLYREKRESMDSLIAKNEILDLVAAARTDKKMHQRKLAAVLRGLNSDRPIEPPSSIEMAAKKRIPFRPKPPDDLESGLDDELPIYKLSE